MSTALVRHTLFLSSSRYVMLAIGFARNIMLAKILGPDDYYFWILFSVVLQYTDFAHLGLRSVGDRDIPRLLGEEQDGKAQSLANDLFGSIVSYSILQAVFFLALTRFDIFAQFLPFSNGEVLFLTLDAIAVIIVTDQLSRYFVMYMRTLHKFVQSSVLETLFELTKTTLIIVLVYSTGVSGIPVGYTIASLAFAAYLLLLFRKDVAFQFNFKLSRQLFGQSAPLFLHNVGTIFILNIDRFFGSYVLTPATMSQYGLGVQLVQLPVLLSFGLRDVLVPTLGNLVGKQNSSAEIKRLLVRAQAAIALITPVFLGGALITIDILTSVFLTEYYDTLKYALWLSMAIFLLAETGVPNITLVIMRRHWLANTSIAASLLVFFASWFMGNTGMSSDDGFLLLVSTSILYLTFFLTSNIPVMLVLKFTSREMISYMRVFLIGLAPYLSWLIIYMLLLDRFDPLLRSAIAAVCLALVFVFPTVYLLKHDMIPSQILSRLKWRTS